MSQNLINMIPGFGKAYKKEAVELLPPVNSGWVMVSKIVKPKPEKKEPEKGIIMGNTKIDEVVFIIPGHF